MHLCTVTVNDLHFTKPAIHEMMDYICDAHHCTAICKDETIFMTNTDDLFTPFDTASEIKNKYPSATVKYLQDSQWLSMSFAMAKTHIGAFNS